MKQEIIEPLNGLRGGAAITVVAGHYGIIDGSPSLGVVLFFVLSGFLIGKLYLDRPFTASEVWTYLIARFARVYPLFAFVVIGVGLLNYLIPSAQIFELGAQQIFPHLMLFGSAMTIWTICTEFQFYFVFVVLWWLRHSVHSPQLVLWSVLVATGVYALVLGTNASRTDVFSYLHVFTIGLLISTMPKLSDPRVEKAAAVMLPIFMVLYLATYLLAPWLYSELGPYLAGRAIYTNPLALFACAGLVAAALAAGDCWFNRLLSLPIATWLGTISFGIYLFHRPAAWLVEATVDHWSGWIKMPLRLALTLAAAQIAYLLIERPCRATVRGWGERALRRQQAVEP